MNTVFVVAAAAAASAAFADDDGGGGGHVCADAIGVRRRHRLGVASPTAPKNSSSPLTVLLVGHRRRYSVGVASTTADALSPPPLPLHRLILILAPPHALVLVTRGKSPWCHGRGESPKRVGGRCKGEKGRRRDRTTSGVVCLPLLRSSSLIPLLQSGRLHGLRCCATRNIHIPSSYSPCLCWVLILSSFFFFLSRLSLRPISRHTQLLKQNRYYLFFPLFFTPVSSFTVRNFRDWLLKLSNTFVYWAYPSLLDFYGSECTGMRAGCMNNWWKLSFACMELTANCFTFSSLTMGTMGTSCAIVKTSTYVVSLLLSRYIFFLPLKVGTCDG